jgi:hypothetical protein
VPRFSICSQADRLRADITKAEIARKVEAIAVAAGVVDPLDLPADLGKERR